MRVRPFQGHVFMDGNKRTSCAAMFTFLALNELDTTLRDPVDTMVGRQERAEEGERTDSLVTLGAPMTSLIARGAGVS